MIDLLRKIMYVSRSEHRARWIIVFVLAIVVSIVEATGMLMIAMLLGLLVDNGTASFPIVGDVRRVMPGLSESQLMVTVAVAVSVFFLLRSFAILCQNYVQYRIVENTGARVATRLMAGYLAMPAERHLQRNSSELVRNASDSVMRMVGEGLVPGVQLLAKLSMVIGVCAVLLITNATAAVGAVAVVGPVSFVMLRLVQPRVKRYGRTAKTMISNNLQALQESLTGWRDIRVLGREQAFIRAYRDDRQKLARAQYLRRTMAQVPRVSIETSVFTFIAAFIAFTVVFDSTDVAFPTLGLFGYAAVRMIPELNSITQSVNSLRFVGPAIDDIYADMLSFESTIVAHGNDVPLPCGLHQALTIDSVNYRYPGAVDSTLTDINMVIHAGESIGIVGSTGGGKSTLIDILLGLVEPSSGRVSVDGVPLPQTLTAWHASIGMVPQTVFLTDDTIRRNVALGVPGPEIDDEAVSDALRIAQLIDFVDTLPNREDTGVGERGLRMSGGQRQRLAIARALYRRPSVLVFDEGTSALDHETELAFLGALERLKRDRTIITVAHRLTTVQKCDRVFLLHDGHIKDQGTFAELRRRNVSLQHALLP